MGIGASIGACGAPLTNQPFLDDADYLAALPSERQITASLPASAEDSESQKAAGQATSTSECNPDELREFTYDSVANLNDYAFQILSILDSVRENPPSERTASSRRWGPYRHPDFDFYLQLTVVKGTSEYAYALELTYDVSNWDVLLHGTFEFSDMLDDGVGEFVHDFTIQSKYFPDSTRIGKVLTRYDAREEVIDISMEGEDIGYEDSTVTRDESYAYYSSGDGSGTFYFSLPTNVYGDENVNELASVWSSWGTNRQGRADIQFQGGDLGEYVAVGYQCWNDVQDVIYYTMPGCETLGNMEECVASSVGWNE